MDSRIMLKMVKNIDRIEKRQKTIESAIADLNVQVDIEKDKKRKRELETHSILFGGEIPQ
jgi:hypothetical protein